MILLKKMLNKVYINFKNIVFVYIRYLDLFNDYVRFRNIDIKGRFTNKISDFYPCLSDNTSLTGFDRHYIYFPAWAFRCLLKYKPKKHVDVSSSLSFCSIVSGSIPIDFYDYRPAKLSLKGLKSKRGDITNLPFKNNSIESISSMHVIEHIGLGRYGDPIDPDADYKAARELVRVVSKGGNLLIVLPVGKQRIQFNAHRIYSYEEIKSMFKGLKLKESYLIPDGDRDPIYNPTTRTISSQEYGCGCFWFVKV